MTRFFGKRIRRYLNEKDEKKHSDKERKRAIYAVKTADTFVVLHDTKGKGGAICELEGYKAVVQMIESIEVLKVQLEVAKSQMEQEDDPCV